MHLPHGPFSIYRVRSALVIEADELAKYCVINHRPSSWSFI